MTQTLAINVLELPRQKRHELKLFPYGNRCGHDPKTPRLLSVTDPYASDDWDKDNDTDDLGHKRKSWFFYDVDQALTDFYYFPKMLPRLGIKHYDDGDSRQRRSDGREAVVAVLKCMVHYMDLTTKRFGYPSKDGFIYYDTKFIMKKTALTKSRVKRALKRIATANYIERTRRWTEREYGKFKALTTATVINEKLLFGDLDVMQGFIETAKYAKEQLYAHAKELGTKVSNLVRCAVLDLTKAIPKPERKDQDQYTDYPEYHRQHWRLQLRADKLRDFEFKVTLLTSEFGNELVDQTAQADIYKQAFHAVK